jgi:hypothetical protein
MDTEACRYDAGHQSQNVPAVATIDGGAVVGLVPACQECADADRGERNRRVALRQQERDDQ